MSLDLSSLKKGFESLGNALGVAGDEEFMSGLNEHQAQAVRAGVIQNFEFSYELCWKFMRRWLEVNYGVTYVEGVARRQLFRLSAENKLIEDVDKWMEYHQARNETSHSYDEDTAVRVFEAAKEFFGDAGKLIEAIEARND